MKKLLILLVILLIIPVKIQQIRIKNLSLERNLQIVQLENSPLNLSNLEKYIYLLNIQYPNIVLKQAILETGWLSSRVCKSNNNLFGLVYNGRYAKFSHWTECVKAYKRFQNKKYNSGCYYKFLVAANYASDSKYIKKLKSIEYGRLG